MVATMEFIELSNGVKMPRVGFGVYQISREETQKCVEDAIEVGYRLIDTAQAYFNEQEVGYALKHALGAGLKREDFFITTKVWLSNYGYGQARQSILRSLELLGVDYIDLVLLHQPFSDYYGAYQALEEFYDHKTLRAIGVSNFYPSRLADLCAFTRIKPHVNQIEINPCFQQQTAVDMMVQLGVQPQAWAPFGEDRNDMFEMPLLKEIGAKYNKSVAQVILRFLVQKDIVPLAKSVRKERMAENLDIFDFTLSPEDMNAIRYLDTNESLFFDHSTPGAVDLFKHYTDQIGGKLV